MEFRKMVMITLYVRQQKRHICIEQSFGLWEWVRLGWFWRMTWKHVYYCTWNESPVQVRCMIQNAQGWCTEMTQRDSMGREVGGGFRRGNTCTPVADSCQCMEKPLQYCKVISLRLKKKKKESAFNAGDLGSIPGLGRSHGERNGNPLQYSCLENSTGRGTWWATVHGDHKELDTT